MAQMKAGFITGANAKIVVGGITLAYCTDVSYNVTVQTIPIEAMGKYEVHSNEPVGYSVDGSLAVIRYTKRAATSLVDDAAAEGNRPEKIDPGAGQGSDWNTHINPKSLLTSSTFDLHIIEKADESGGANDVEVVYLEDCRLTRRGASLNKRGVMVDQYNFVAILAGDGDNSTEGKTAHSSMAGGGKDLS